MLYGLKTRTSLLSDTYYKARTYILWEYKFTCGQVHIIKHVHIHFGNTNWLLENTYMLYGLKNRTNLLSGT